MKNKKILLTLMLVAAIVVTAVALAGCNDRPEKVFAGTAADLGGFRGAKQIYLDATDISHVPGSQLLFVTIAGNNGTNTYKLYNFVTDKEITSFTAGSGSAQALNNLIVVKNENVINEVAYTDLSFFDFEGKALNNGFISESTVLFENSDTGFSLENGTDPGYIILNNVVYLVKGGKFVVSFEKGASFDPSIADYEYESENYFFVPGDDEETVTVRVFEKNGNLHTVADITENKNASTSSTSVFYLSEDKIVVQYTDRCADDENSYDYLTNGSKYEVRTYIFDAKKSKWSEKKSFKYVIDLIFAAEHEGEKAFDDSIKDIMVARKFSKKALSDHFVFASVNDSLKIKIDFDDVFEGYVGHQAFADGYIIKTKSGDNYFVSKDGKDYVKAETISYDTPYFDNGSGVIYKYESGKAVEQGRYDISRYSVVSVVGGYVIYQDAAGAYYAGAFNADPAALSTANVSINMYDGFFTKTTTSENASPVIELYSANGTNLAKLGGAIDKDYIVAHGSDASGKAVMVISVSGSDNAKMYYRLG